MRKDSTANLVDDSWSRNGWRTNTAVQVCWVTFALTAVPILMTFLLDWSFGPAFMAFSVATLIAALNARRFPRLAVLVPISFYFSVSVALLFDSGYAAPGAALGLAMFVCLPALLWGIRGMAVAASVAIVLVALAGYYLFGPPDGAANESADAALYTLSVPNYVRMTFIVFFMIMTLAIVISLIIRRQERYVALLRQESSERLEAERAFQQAQRSALVAQVTSGLAHNFGNALTVITSWAELLDRHPNDVELHRRGIQDVRTAAKQASGVAQQIMKLGKDQAREPETIDLSAEVLSHIRLLRTVLPSAVRLRESIEADLHVLFDQTELQQGLFNLVLNARDAVAGNGRIDVRAYRTDDGVVLEVKDDGSGMPDEVLEHIFEPFFTTKGEGGAGLGLATLQRSMRAVSGEITVDSESGKGSIFRLHFPSAEARASREETYRHDVSETARKGRILVVDDEAMVRNVIALGLANSGYDIVEAEDIPSGIASLVDDSLDMLLTDAVMPGGKLVDLVNAFRQTHPNKPVIVCSGYMPEEVLVDLSHDKAIEFVQKPMDLRALTEKVDSLLAA